LGDDSVPNLPRHREHREAIQPGAGRVGGNLYAERGWFCEWGRVTRIFEGEALGIEGGREVGFTSAARPR